MAYKLAGENKDSLNKQTFCETANAKVSKSICERFCRSILITVMTVIYIGFVGFVMIKIYSTPLLDDWPKFNLTVSSVDGLLPSNPWSTTISPVFNLTLHVDSSNARYKLDSIENGETRVFYRQVQIVAAATAWFCKEPSDENVNDVMLHAWDMELALPLFVRNQLFQEVKNGECKCFEVELIFDLMAPHSLGRIFIDCSMVNANATMSPCKHYVNLPPIDRFVTQQGRVQHNG